MAFLYLRKEIERNKLRKREVVITDLEDGIKLYEDLCKNWVFKSIKAPMISMY
jgi:hypothetical protein